MKLNPTLLLGIAIAFPGAAGAEAPIPGESLAQVQSTLDYCTRINSADADHYRRQAEALVRGQVPAKIAALRQSEEYKQAYAETSAALAKSPPEDALVACKDFLAPKND